MTTMKLAGAAWSFVGATLPESAAILRALGVQAMDLIAMPGGLLDSAEIERDPHGQARRVSEAGLPVGNLLFFFGDGFDVRPLNSADDGVRAANRETFTRVLQFCTAADIPSVLVLPGVDQEGISHDEAVRLSAAEMNELAALAATENVLLLFEPHIESVLESPSDTLAFLQQNPALKIVLDYSHYVAQGYQPDDVDPLVPYAGHVHLRQACRGQLQARWDDGVIDFPAVVELLKASGYGGYLTLEYEHDPWMDCDKVDVMTETIRMRDEVRPLLAT
ncbi:MAG: sugar phosphate isomerase/epimerase [Caldilineaceae bacterium]|nr:sugar phosphate isomerase/epimerase [Caldilineaceae bacterium]MDE0431741.1 sugar phosphate isomerase/epimerase [Caldilineaceae bacterium]